MRPDPFSTFEFFENFLQHDADYLRGRGLRLWFLAAFEAEHLIGYMALKQVTHHVMGLRADKLDFLVTHDADRPQLVAASQHALGVSEAFYTYLLGRKHEWSFLEFRQQEAASPLFPPPAAVNLREYWVDQWPGMDNGTIAIQWDSLAAYFKSFSKKFRSNVSRQMRSLLAAGEVEYLVSSDPDTTPALFELYRSIEQRSWKSHAGTAIGRHARWNEYFKGLLAAGQPTRMSIHVLLLDGLPIAGLITGAFEKGLYALHIVSDKSMSRLAPGSAVLLMSMRAAIEGAYTFFNLLSGFGYYKARWQARMTETRNVQIYRRGTPFFWHRLLGDWKRKIFPRAAAHHGALLYNPVRRELDEHDHTAESASTAEPKPLLSAAERERIAALIAQVRQGRGEFLSAAELAAVMPFETQRTVPKAGPLARTPPASAPQACWAPGSTGTVLVSRNERSTMPITLQTSPASTPSRAPAVPNWDMPQ